MDINKERPTVKRAAKDLAKVASLERLRKRIIVPNMTDSISSDEEYMNETHDINNIPETVILETIENEREPEENNEDVIETFHLSDYEGDDMVFEYEVHQENDALEGSDDDDEDDIQENHFETEEHKANYVKENLKEWATYDGIISKKKLDNLLLRLNPVFPTLPKSYKTLLHTPKHLDIFELPDGSMLWYKGIVRNLDAMLLDKYLEKYGNITIDVNMDGLPIAKTSRIKFWPQLGRLVYTDNDPFVIGLYVGEWDPIDVHSYLNDFVTEVEHLLQHGYVRNGIRYQFIIRNFILDAPARSLVKCCVGHNGYSACEKCTVVGEYIDDRMTFLDLHAPLRTDESFANQDDPLHHTGVTILLRIANMFIVVKFLPILQDNNIYYEVALAKWLIQIDDNMMGKLLWPNNDSAAGKLVRSEATADATWQQLEVQVKRYYDTYIAARKAAKGFEELSSAYESESGSQMGRGKRRKLLLNPITSDDDSSASETTKWKQAKLKSKLPAAPLPPSLLTGQSSQKSLSVSKNNIAELTFVPIKKQGKTATVSPTSTAASTYQNKLVQKIINVRQHAAEKAQQRKEAMSFRNKLCMTKKATNSTLYCDIPVTVLEADENCKSAPQSSSIVPPLNSQYEQSLSDNSDMSNEDRGKRNPKSGETSEASSHTASTSTWATNIAKSSNLYEYLTKLDQKVDNMRAKLDMILINQSKINRILLPEAKVLSKPVNIPALPLDTIEQVTIFEKFLSNDVNLSDTCYYLQSLPLGNDEVRATPKLMSHLISNSLAQQYNFDGHGAKIAFKSTKLWELIQGTLLLKFEKSDLSDALKSLRSWLRNAKGRKC